MKITTLSIGQALAIIIHDRQNKHIDYLKLNNQDKDYINTIKDRYLDLDNKPDELEKIINTVPGEDCPADMPFLKNNTDFFIAYIILSEKNQKNLNTTPHFIKHLNDCYWCFKNYNKFIREFYFTTQKIKGEVKNE